MKASEYFDFYVEHREMSKAAIARHFKISYAHISRISLKHDWAGRIKELFPPLSGDHADQQAEPKVDEPEVVVEKSVEEKPVRRCNTDFTQAIQQEEVTKEVRDDGVINPDDVPSLMEQLGYNLGESKE